MKGHFEQTQFNAGIWSPLLDGRTDLAKYKNSLSRLENMIVWPHGPAQMRPGFRYIAEIKTSSETARLIPFEFSTTQAYVIEMGNLYFRFYKDQAQILSGASAYEVTTTYAEADLDEVKYCQSADVLYLFHKDYESRKLSRTGHTAWTLSTINWQSPALDEQGLEPNTTLTPAATTGTGIDFTAGAAVFQTGDIGRIITSGAGRASIVSFTSTSVVVCDIIDDFASTDPIASGSWKLEGSPVGELTFTASEPKGAIVTVTATAGGIFPFDGELETRTALLAAAQDYWTVSGSGTDEYFLKNSAPGYTAVKPDRVYINDVLATEGVLGSLGILQWAFGDNDANGFDSIYTRLSDGTDPDSKAATSTSYVERATATTDAANVFRSTDVDKYIVVYGGLIRITSYTSATEVKGEILKTLSSTDATVNWTLEGEAWNATDGYPSCGTFFEERLVVARDETVWGSVVGDYENHTPGTDDSDAYEFTLSGRKVNIIRWIEPREYLVLGTVGSEWRLGPEDTGAPLTPLNVVAKQVTSQGCYDHMPVTVDGSTLFIQRAGKKIRELTYDFQKGEAGGYVAPDLTQLAQHLFVDGIKTYAYQKEPLSTLWIATQTGGLVGLTYLRAEDVVACHEHPIDGEVESLACIPGDGYDELWAIIKRTINGSVVRYVEMMEAIFEDDADTYTTNKGLNAFFVDCGYTYNGASTSTITGLDHLEGEEVAVLADGAMQKNKTVSSGSITLDKAATIVHVGLPYTATIETQRISGGMSDGTIQGRQKRVVDMVVRVKDSGPFKVGRDANNLDTKYDPERELVYGQPYPLFSGDLRIGYEGTFDRDAKIMIVQDKPMPLTVQSIYPIVEA